MKIMKSNILLNTEKKGSIDKAKYLNPLSSLKGKNNAKKEFKIP